MATLAFRNKYTVQSYHGLYSIEHMVYRENILPDLRDHVVSLDFPEIENRSIVESGMEIFVADKYVQLIAGNVDRDNGMAFLSREFGVGSL